MNIPWLAPYTLAIPNDVHHFARHPKNVLSKFDPDKKEPVEDHMNKFVLALRFLNVEHEDIVLRIFPFKFEGKSFTWYSHWHLDISIVGIIFKQRF